MGGRAVSLSAALVALAKKHEGTFVTTSDAVRVIFNGDGTKLARKRIYQAIYSLRGQGRLRCKRGAFALPVVVAPKRSLDDDLAAVTPRPAGRAALADTLNKFARLRNAYDQAFDDLLTEARHAIRVSEPAPGDVDEPAGLPMRCAEPGEREPCPPAIKSAATD